MALPLDQILSLLRDQSWGFVGVLVALIPYLINVIRKNRKQIAYKFIVDEFRSTPNGIIRVIRLKLWNCGNEAVSTHDFVDPIELIFPSTAQVLAVRLVESAPSRIRVPLDNGGDRVIIRPFMLQEKEHIVIEMEVETLDEDIDVYARINGNVISTSREQDRLLKIAASLRKYFVALVILWVLCLIAHTKFPDLQAIYYISLVFAILTFLVVTRIIVTYVSIGVRYR